MLNFVNARNKAKQINSNKIIIAADTIVYLDGEVFEKPVDRQDCIRMMKALSGRVHKLITGVVVKGVLEQETFEVTELEVDDLTDEVINAIADSPAEWADHSGGYSIDQKYGATIFKRINGSYHNIIGLPALITAKLLLIEHEEYLKSQNNQN